MKVKWESVEQDGNHDGWMHRARVHGGWLVRYTSDTADLRSEAGTSPYGYEWRHTMTFVPDPNGEWT